MEAYPMLSWMLASTLAAAAAAAATTLITALISDRRSNRGVWAVGIAFSVAFSAFAWWAPLPAPAVFVGVGAPEAVVVAGEPVGSAAPARLASLAASLGPWLVPLWLATSSVLLISVGLSAVRLHRRVTRWRPTWMHGARVRISHRSGPAVVGVLRPVIVLPSWVLDEPDEAQAFIVRHEREHVAARDPWLVLAAFLAVACLPWNAALWWQLRRLRDAVEVDCDRRMLTACSARERRRYGALLVRVAHHLRSSGPRPALASFAERGTTLERRIRTMLHLIAPMPYKQRAALALGGATLLALSCALPGDRPSSPTEVELEAASSEIVEVPATEEPVWTPYEVGPEIANREQVQQALVQEYPAMLRDAGIGGIVRVWFHLDETGRVTATRIMETSGHEGLDEAALRVANTMEFEPAVNRGEPVAVWVAFPIRFEVR
jgi:TonB family protein